MHSRNILLIAGLVALAACADTTAGPPPAPSGVQILTGDGQEQAAGVQVRTAPTVRVTDADGHPMRGIAVTFAASRNATVDPVVAVTAADGIASTTWTLRSDGGEDTLLAKVDSLPPAEFHATSMVFTEISAGFQGTCGVVTGGRAFCWGENHTGRLGTGDTLDVHQPAPVTGGARYARYALGTATSCGLSLDGQLYCAGYGGRSIPPYGPSPQQEGGALRFSKVQSSTFDIFCGLESSAVVYCWGGGLLGYPPPVDTVAGARALFMTVPGGPALDFSVETATGVFSSPEMVCLTRPSSNVTCYNLWIFGDQMLSVVVPGSVTQLTAAPGAVCWLESAVDVWCAGPGTGYVPTRVGLPDPALALDARELPTGEWLGCALTDPGIYCWSTMYQFGGPVLEAHSGAREFRKFSLASDHICALDAHSRAWCWGANDHGQLGDGTTDSSAVPRPVKFAL